MTKEHAGCQCTWLADWIIRAILALVFLTAAYNKLFITGVESFAQFSNLPIFIAWLVSLGELTAGLGIIVGGLIPKQQSPKSWVTRISGAIICVIMLGAIFIVKWGSFKAGFLLGVQGMYDNLALFALGVYYLTSGNACPQCTICKK